MTPATGFGVRAYELVVDSHPNADRLELARIGGYLSIVPKGRYATGDVALYIPEAAIVPMPILRDLGLVEIVEKDGETREKGRLAGSKGDRVKAMRLRGVLSQGLVWQPDGVDLVVGEDYADEHGIVKWEPPIPPSLSGQVIANGKVRTYTDIENIKKFPDVLIPGEEVVITEKLHGTMSLASVIDGEFVVSSKGLSGRGLVIARDETPEGKTKNTYWRAFESIGAQDALAEIAAERGASEVSLFGETFGAGIQDLRYGRPGIDFRAFDLRVDGAYLDREEFIELMDRFGIERVPTLYEGPYSPEVVAEHTDGTSTMADHIREGVVVKPRVERHDDMVGRVVLKSISEDYLTRKGGTEYN